MKNTFNKEDYQEIKTRIEALAESSPALWGKMNVNEMLVHLTDQIRLALDERKSTPQGPAIFHTWLGSKMALYLVPWRKGKETSPQEMNKDIGGTPVKSFQEDKTMLLKKLEQAMQAEPQSLAPHPLFGKFYGKDWGRMLYKHIDHHLKQFGG